MGTPKPNQPTARSRSLSGTLKNIRAAKRESKKSPRQLGHADIDQHKTNAPEAAAHQVHAHQSRHEEVDVPAARFFEGNGNWVLVPALFGPEQQGIDPVPCQDTFRTSLVILVAQAFGS